MNDDLKRESESQASAEEDHRLGALPASDHPRDLDGWWPVHPTAQWAEGLSLRREDMYEDRVTFTGSVGS